MKAMSRALERFCTTFRINSSFYPIHRIHSSPCKITVIWAFDMYISQNNHIMLFPTVARNAVLANRTDLPYRWNCSFPSHRINAIQVAIFFSSSLLAFLFLTHTWYQTYLYTILYYTTKLFYTLLYQTHLCWVGAWGFFPGLLPSQCQQNITKEKCHGI